MFAVKGWNITAPIKTQVAPPPQQTTGAADELGNGGGSSNKKSSKKRKRTADSEGQDTKPQQQDAQVKKPSEQSSPVTRDEKPAKTLKQKQRSRREGRSDQLSTAVADGGEKAQIQPKQKKQDPEDGEANGEASGSSKKKRKKDKRHKQDEEEDVDQKGKRSGHSQSEIESASTKVAEITKSLPAQPPPAPSNLTPLQAAMRQKLISSRFRHLNETLYTTKSAESAELFRTNPSFFTEYHEGFARQVSSWPENPVDGFAALLVARGCAQSKGYTPGKLKGIGDEGKKLRERADLLSSGPRGGGTSKVGAGPAPGAVSMGVAEPLPRDQKSRETVVVDLGCGTGALARQLQPFKEALRLRLHSFDLASPNEHVTVADIRNLPLPDSSIDIAVFSLALMGTNWIDFIEEAWRVLKWKGECWVADVNSRFAGQATAIGAKATNGGRAGQVVPHSVGARVKNGAGGKHGANKAANGQDEEEGEAFMEENDDDNNDPSSASTGSRKKGGSGTDVSAFVAVLQRRGFILLGDPDVSNKMFARMRFSKAAAPTRGKCSRQSQGHDRRSYGRGGGSMAVGKKFIDRKGAEDEIKVEDEAKVLKPCVYKTR